MGRGRKPAGEKSSRAKRERRGLKSYQVSPTDTKKREENKRADGLLSKPVLSLEAGGNDLCHLSGKTTARLNTALGKRKETPIRVGCKSEAKERQGLSKQDQNRIEVGWPSKGGKQQGGEGSAGKGDRGLGESGKKRGGTAVCAGNLQTALNFLS